MKKFLIAASVLVLTVGTAQAQMLNTLSFSLLGGWSSHPNLSFGGVNDSVNDGYNIGGRVGTDLPMIPGLEVAADYFYNRSSYTGTGTRLNSSSGMGDLIYHLPLDWPVNLYGGAGLGVVNDDLSGSLHGSSMVFGWQALGGVEYPVADNTSLFAEYRYQNAHDANIGAIGGVGNTSNNLSVGVKFHL